MRFLDANIFLRYLTRDDEARARACYELFQQLLRGETEATTSEAIVAEVVYVLGSQTLYALSHEEIAARLMPLLQVRGLRLSPRSLYLRALDLFANSAFLDFQDALAVAHMEEAGIAEIISYDRDFDRISGVRRVEP